MDQGKTSEPKIVVQAEVDDPKPKKQNNGVIAATQQVYQGPIPPAAEFAKYGQVVKTAPERILKVFEQDSLHTREMQEKALQAEIARDKRGQWMAFAVFIMTIALTAFALWLQQNIAATIAALASLFLVFKGVFSKNDKHDRDKQDSE